MKLKRDHEKAVRTTVSMPPAIYETGIERAKRASFTSFSDYVQALIRADKQQGITTVVI